MAATARRQLAASVVTALAAALVLWVLQPAFTLPGDPAAVKAEARHLIAHGELGFPIDNPGAASGFISDAVLRGQYMHENQDRGRYFSRWGLFATLYFAVPLAFADEGDAHAELRALNALHAILGGLLILGLMLLSLHYAPRIWLAWLSAAAVVPASFALFYVRAHSTELIQMVCAVWMLVCFNRLRTALTDGSTLRHQLLLTAAAHLCGCVLFALKLYFYPLLMVLGLATWRITRGHEHARAIRAISLGILGGMGLLRGVVNLYQFGDFFALGVGAENPLEKNDFASPAYYPRCLATYVAHPRGSLFLHAPFLLLVPLGLVPLWRRSRDEFMVTLAGMLLLIVVAGATRNCLGEWSHGPRWLLPAVPMLAGAFTLAISEARSLKISPRYARLVAPLGVLVVVVGTALELPVQRFHPFAFYQLIDALQNRMPSTDDATRYFETMPQYAVMQDLAGLCAQAPDNTLALLLAEGVKNVPAEEARKIIAGVGGLCEPNVLPPWR